MLIIRSFNIWLLEYRLLSKTRTKICSTRGSSVPAPANLQNAMFDRYSFILSDIDKGKYQMEADSVLYAHVSCLFCLC
jgi:hypothetical protein